jgi:hypothetical protein
MMPPIAINAVSASLVVATLIASAAALRPWTPVFGSAAPANQGQAPIILKNAAISPSARGTIVTLEASARLPPPVVGTLDSPPRVFLDFYGVRPAALSARFPGSGVVTAVRFILNTREPPVTRVFIDLRKMASYVIESAQGDAARLRIVLSSANGPAKPEATPPPAPPVASPRPAAPPRNEEPPRRSPGPEPEPPKTSANDLKTYRSQASESLQRLIDLRPLLASIDRRAAISVDSLQLAVEEFRDIRAEVLALDAPRPFRGTHDMLLRACALALQAANTRLEAVRTANTNAEWNAASAAAGAIMLIDRARAELRPEGK